MMFVKFVLVLFVTVMVRENWHPVPTFTEDGTRVISRAFHVHKPWVLRVVVLVRVPVQKVPTTLLSESFLSVLSEVLLIRLNV